MARNQGITATALLGLGLAVTGACGDNWPAQLTDRDAATPDAVVPDGAVPDADGPGPAYTVVVLPDTQYYASSWPDIFAAQTQWILDHRADENIAFVLHVGDIVDSDLPDQWQRASDSLHLLDGQVPYLLAAGNHDYGNLADRMGMINNYFPPSNLSSAPWFQGTFDPGHVENSYGLLSAGSGRWLVLALEFGPRDEVLAWADTVLSSFPDTPAAIVTHAFLSRDGTRYDHTRGGQEYNPHDYVMMGQPGTTINDGEEMWRKLVEPHANVKLVLSGHDVNHGALPPGTTARLTSTRADGTRVHQLLANYQTCVNPPCERDISGATVRGGNGYLRLLRIDPAARSLTVTTYSPFVGASLTDDGNQFVLDLD